MSDHERADSIVARIDAASFFASYVSALLALAIFVLAISHPERASVSAALVPVVPGMVWYFMVAGNGLELRGTTLVLRAPFKSPEFLDVREFEFRLIGAGLSENVARRPYTIELISKVTRAEMFSIPAKIYNKSDVNLVLDELRNRGCVTEGD